ncbi:16S rRNA (cytidine(1402)-2'-O)-methyltransferase [Bartonella sp. DGB2]|uniref:16S rRNA (cytidine(1402)-2'-O)-methyltransferase n=1 Tax=Bartonella sp. DGB2 TaxID=3388426 RepID=UPI00398FAFA3
MDNKSYTIDQYTYHAPALEAGLYLVSTPIGNLLDISLRALAVLAGVDFLACEDKRVTSVLLARYGIRQKMLAYHEYNAKTSGSKILSMLHDGRAVALVSDAGTPLISDPGFKLVEEARQAGVKIIPIPGASALLAALTSSGVPSNGFFFAGFLSPKAIARRARLEELRRLKTTIILYEAPHRVQETLRDLLDIFGPECKVALCRELTKRFETVDQMALKDLAEIYSEKARIRGEIVLVIGASPEVEIVDEIAIDRLLKTLLEQYKPAQAAAQAAKITGLHRKELFQRLLTLKANSKV